MFEVIEQTDTVEQLRQARDMILAVKYLLLAFFYLASSSTDPFGTFSLTAIFHVVPMSGLSKARIWRHIHIHKKAFK